MIGVYVRRKFHPQYEASLWVGELYLFREVFAYRPPELEAIGMERLPELAQVVLIPACSQKATYRRLLGRSRCDAMVQFQLLDPVEVLAGATHPTL